jgi:non-receptor tyrosine-protein kinase TYK2
MTGEKSVQLVMEYVPLGSLRDYLPRHSVGLVQLLLFAQQICEVGWLCPYFQNLPPPL